MENSTLSLNLIKNSYDAYESKKMLCKLIDDKVKFIKMQILSIQERFGTDSPFLQNRLKELYQSKEELMNFFKSIDSGEIDANDIEIKIDCPIHLEIVQKSTAKKGSKRLKGESSFS